MTPAPVSIVDRGTFCLMDLSRVGYVISICEYDERGKVVLRPDFRGQRLNLYCGKRTFILERRSETSSG